MRDSVIQSTVIGLPCMKTIDFDVVSAMPEAIQEGIAPGVSGASIFSSVPPELAVHI